MTSWVEEHITHIIVGVVVLLIAVVGALIYKDALDWQHYAAEHNCRKSGYSQTPPTVAPIIGTNGGVSVIVNPGTYHDRYVCDGNIEVWR